MNKLLIREIDTIRNPFKVKRLPLMARFCKVWFDCQVDAKKRLKGKFFRGLYVKLLRLGFNPQGAFEIDLKGKKTAASFRVRNTQYTSLFLDRFEEAYEAEVSVLLDILLPPDGVFNDIGANFGYFTLFAASKPDFRGKIYSFEPNPETFSDLKKHVDELHLGESVFPNCMGLSEKDDFIHVRPSGVRSGTFTLSDQTEIEDGAYKVKLQRLDDLNLPLPSIMKIDTEGSEIGVLRGAEQTLKKSGAYIIMETTLNAQEPFKTLAPLKFLEQHDYILYHAGWAQEKDAMVCVQNEEDVPPGSRKLLSLYPFTSDQRFLMTSRLNILAVPRMRLPELAQKFKSKS